jgi:lipopolysaccharide export system permease protein
LFIYEKYILRKLIAVFLLTVVFFTATLFIFNIFRIARHVAAGLQLTLALRLFLYLVPSLLGYSIPFGVLVACLLVYGKLSAQNEILALRVNGVGLHRIASAMAMLGVGAFLLAVFVFGVVSPKGKYAVRELRNALGSINPIFLFEPGETIDVFPGYSIYLRRKQGNRLYDVVIDHEDRKGLSTHIGAKSAVIEHHRQSGKISLTLYDVKVIVGQRDRPHLWDESDESMRIDFDLAAAVQKIEIEKREDDMTFRELLASARIATETGGDPNLYLTEVNKRLVLSLACLSFAIIGTPLGIRVHRGEKTVGVSIGIGLAMSFYTVVMFAERLRDNPRAHPHLLMWLPNLLLIALGILFFRRIRRGLG